MRDSNSLWIFGKLIADTLSLPGNTMRRRQIVFGCIATFSFIFLMIKTGVLDLSPPEDVVKKDDISIGSIGGLGDGSSNGNDNTPSQAMASSRTKFPTQSPIQSPAQKPHSQSLPSASNSKPTNKPISSIVLPDVDDTPLMSSDKARRKDNTDFTPTEESFLNQYCDFSPKASTDANYGWYPSSEPSAWKQRTPAIIIAGTQQSATSGLYNMLLQHPNIQDDNKGKNKEFFLPSNYGAYLRRRDGNGIRKRIVFQAREKMFARHYATSQIKKSMRKLLVAMDGTSQYFSYSDQVPYNVLCTAPWSKIVLILRDPIERVYAQWSYQKAKHNLKVSFDEWIAMEIGLMQNAGLLLPDNEDKRPPDAWEKYLQLVSRHPTLQEPGLGASMYDISLERWIQAYQLADKDVSKEFFIMPMEALLTNSDELMPKLLEFVGLPPMPQDDYAGKLSQPLYPIQSEPMSEETRSQLKDFFANHNKRLFRLLKKNKLGDVIGNANWKKIWEQQ